MSFSENYQNIYNLVTKEIEEVKSKMLSGVSDADMLTEDLLNFIKAPSKCIRTLMCILYLKAMNIPINPSIITFLAVIELIHNGSLIHDDIIDNSEIRRGEKSLNAKFGNHLSVIAGDFVLSVALKFIAEINNPDIAEKISDTIASMCRGEINQYFNKNKIPVLDDYIQKTYNKTGILFETAMRGSMLLGCGNIPYSAEKYAKNFGIAFQIKNDITDLDNVNSDSDLNNGIYTAPLIYSDNPKDLSSGIEKAQTLLDNYLQEAKNNISDIEESVYKSSLLKLLELIRYE